MPKRFRELMDKIEHASSGERAAKDPTIYFHFHEADVLGGFILSQMLKESAKHVNLGQGRHVYRHAAHTNPGQEHLHFVQKGAKLYALNKDGTAHDASHGKQMERWAIDAVKDNFPGFTVPKDGLIETMMAAKSEQILTEAYGGDVPSVPITVLRDAESRDD